jgi:hypothetical protein
MVVSPRRGPVQEAVRRCRGPSRRAIVETAKCPFERWEDWSGIHFRTADEVSIVIGSSVANYTLDHYFQPTN